MLGCNKESERSKIAVINFTYIKTHTHRYPYTHINKPYLQSDGNIAKGFNSVNGKLSFCHFQYLAVRRHFKGIYNSLFKHFVSNKLFTPSESGFLPVDLCIAQLLSLIYEIHTNFDSNLPVDVRDVF